MSTLRLIAPDGQFHEVTADVARIGRDPSSEVHLPDPSVSRSHSLLERLPDGTWVVSDQNSANGTRVDGRAVQRSPLQHGQTLQVGLLSFAVQVHTGEQGPTVFVDRALLERAAAQRAGRAEPSTGASEQTVLAPRHAGARNNFLWLAVGSSSGAALALLIYLLASTLLRPAAEPASTAAAPPPSPIPASPMPTPAARAPIDPAETAPRAPALPSAAAVRASLLLVADEPCDIRVDDARVARLAAGGVKRISVSLGEHYVVATAPDGRRWEQIVATRQPEQLVIRVQLPPGPPASTPTAGPRVADAAPSYSPSTLPAPPPTTPPEPAATPAPSRPAPTAVLPAPTPATPPATRPSEPSRSTTPTAARAVAASGRPPLSGVPDFPGGEAATARRLPAQAPPLPPATTAGAPPTTAPRPMPPPATPARSAPAGLGQFDALAAPGRLGSAGRKPDASGQGTLLVRAPEGSTVVVDDARRVSIRGGEASLALESGMHVVVLESPEGRVQWQRLVSITNGGRELIAGDPAGAARPGQPGGPALDLTSWEGAWTLDAANRVTVNGCPVSSQQNWYVYVSRDLRDTSRLAPAELSLVYTHNLDRSALAGSELTRCQQAAGETAAYQARFALRIDAAGGRLEGQFSNCELADCRLAPREALGGPVRLENGRLVLGLGGGRTLALSRAR